MKGLRVAYLASRYPTVNHTYILGEIPPCARSGSN